MESETVITIGGIGRGRATTISMAVTPCFLSSSPGRRSASLGLGRFRLDGPGMNEAQVEGKGRK
jgi:hypothetical protein